MKRPMNRTPTLLTRCVSKKKSLRKILCALVIDTTVCFMMMPFSLFAATFEWNQGSGGGYLWSDASNWTGGNIPTGATDTVVVTLTNAMYLPAGFLQISSNDIGAITINKLVPRGTGPATGWATNILRGGTLTFDGTTPRIDYDHRSNLVYIIENDLVLNKTLQVATTGNNTPIGTFIFSGTISGPGGLGAVHRDQQNNNANVTLLGMNTYSGATYVNSGLLRFNSIANVGYGASALGNPSPATNAIIEMGMGGSNATLEYIGTNSGGHSTDRPIRLVGTGGAMGLTASGLGPIRYMAGVINSGNTDRAFTLSGNSTSENLVASMAGNRLNVNKTGDGLWIIGSNGPNSISNLAVNGGVLRLSAGVYPGVGTISFYASSLGILELADNLERPGGTGPGQIAFGIASGRGGGFSAKGADVRVVFGSFASPESLVWGELPFRITSYRLYLNSVYADRTVEFVNPINLSNVVRAVEVGAVTGILSGVLSSTGAGGLQKYGRGVLVLPTNNTYSGNTIVSEGTLVAAHSNACGVTGSITVQSNATFAVGEGVTFHRSVTFAVGSALGGLGTYLRGSVWTTPTNFTLRPGLPGTPGTLTVDTGGGDLTLGPSNTVEISFSPARAGRLQVNGGGSLNLSAPSVRLVLKGSVPTGQKTFEIVRAGTIIGTFSQVDTSELVAPEGGQVVYPGDGRILLSFPAAGTVILIR